MEDKSRIRDNASIQKLLRDAENFRRFKAAMPLLTPFFRLLGADTKGIKSALAKVPEISREVEELARVLDDFNDLFAAKGWISYELMDFTVAKAAVERAKAGDVEGAESDLVAHFDPETVRFGLRTMQAVKAFRPRMALAEKALVDYEEGRYHACVPVILALLDGMVNEVHQKARGTRRGISAEGVDLSAWDSFAAHQTGLNRLLKVIQTGRRKTTTEAIRIPYRNGIMHGVDLGYDNRIVAAKTWALLFASREWALRAERDELDAPPAEPEPTWREALAQLRDSARRTLALEEWKRTAARWHPRNVTIGKDLPATGVPEAFPPNTPERALVEYLSFWSKRNYGLMAKQAVVAGSLGVRNGPARVRAELRDKHLVDWALVSVADFSIAITDIDTELVVDLHGERTTIAKSFRVMYAGRDGLPAIAEPGEWAVFTWTV